MKQNGNYVPVLPNAAVGSLDPIDVGPTDVGPMDVGPMDSADPMDVGPMDVGTVGSSKWKETSQRLLETKYSSGKILEQMSNSRYVASTPTTAVGMSVGK